MTTMTDPFIMEIVSSEEALVSEGLTGQVLALDRLALVMQLALIAM